MTFCCVFFDVGALMLMVMLILMTRKVAARDLVIIVLFLTIEGDSVDHFHLVHDHSKMLQMVLTIHPDVDLLLLVCQLIHCKYGIVCPMLRALLLQNSSSSCEVRSEVALLLILHDREMKIDKN